MVYCCNVPEMKSSQNYSDLGSNPAVIEQLPEFRYAPKVQAPWPHLDAVLERLNLC